MRRQTVLILGLLLMLAWLGYRFSVRETPSQPPNPVTSVERTPVCPWREPQQDLAILFPQATSYVLETRILSGLMVPLQKRLGRAMTVDENPLRIFRVQAQERWVGSVLLRRVKGEHGGIEIVTGVATNGTVHGVRIQSQREPESVAQSLTDSNFLNSFVGKTSASPLRAGEDLPGVASETRPTAQAIADGVRSQLIVLAFAEQSREASEVVSHRNH
jgi:hypothetical protein